MEILKAIIIGLLVAFVIFLITSLYKMIRKQFLKYKTYNWLKENTKDKASEQFRSIEEIVKGTGLEKNIVQTICETHKKISQNKNEKDFWGIYGEEPKSIYEERGIINL